MEAEKNPFCVRYKKVLLNLCVETKAYYHGTCQTDHFEQEHLFHLDTQLRRLFLFYKISAVSGLMEKKENILAKRLKCASLPKNMASSTVRLHFATHPTYFVWKRLKCGKTFCFLYVTAI